LGPLCNSLFIKKENEMTVKLHCQLFTNGKPLNDNTQSISTAQLPSRPKDLGWPVRVRADAITMINDGVTNLGGKSLNKLIHCFLVMLIKEISFFSKHALLCKGTVNAHTHTWNLYKEIWLVTHIWLDKTLCNTMNVKLGIDTVS